MTYSELRALGFDDSTRAGKHFTVRCSQCQAAAINGVPCHETGCPNATKECRECDARIPVRADLCQDCYNDEHADSEPEPDDATD